MLDLKCVRLCQISVGDVDNDDNEDDGYDDDSHVYRRYLHSLQKNIENIEISYFYPLCFIQNDSQNG